jgi:ABC-type nitrate/sulfonate/bicarbonate transport system permease component
VISLFTKIQRFNLPGLFTLLMVLLVWDTVARWDLFGVGRAFFPPAGDVLAAWWQMVVSGELPKALLVTLRAYVQGFLLSAVIGIALGICMARSRVLTAILTPLVEFLRPMPSVAVIPLAIVFFGIGDEMKRFVATYGALWPVLLNTFYGINSADSRLAEVARMFRLGELRVTLSIMIPAASPFIMTGLRIGSILTLGLVITAELLASGDGVGNVIQSEQLAFKVPETFAGVITVMLLGVLVNALFAYFERRIMHWHVGMMKGVMR